MYCSTKNNCVAFRLKQCSKGISSHLYAGPGFVNSHLRKYKLGMKSVIILVPYIPLPSGRLIKLLKYFV